MIIASIQARLGSSRLPKKVLMEFDVGLKSLDMQIKRVLKSKYVNKVIVATSNNKLDDEIENFCKVNSYDCFRGSEDDLLLRLTNLSHTFRHDVHVELFGDCPFIDPIIIDHLIEKFQENSVEYLTNSSITTYPPGMEVSIFKPDILTRANEYIAANDEIREHISVCLNKTIEEFNIPYLNITAEKKYFRPNYYFELDERRDFIFLNSLLNSIYPSKGLDFSLDDLIKYVDSNPNIISNNDVERRWKAYRKDT